MITSEITEKIAPILRKHDVSFAGLFGSRARGEEGEGSDFDLLVKFGVSKSLFDLVDLEDDLSETLDADVDVVTEGALSPRLKSAVLRDLLVLYGKR